MKKILTPTIIEQDFKNDIHWGAGSKDEEKISWDEYIHKDLLPENLSPADLYVSSVLDRAEKQENLPTLPSRQYLKFKLSQHEFGERKIIEYFRNIPFNTLGLRYIIQNNFHTVMDAKKSIITTLFMARISQHSKDEILSKIFQKVYEQFSRDSDTSLERMEIDTDILSLN